MNSQFKTFTILYGTLFLSGISIAIFGIENILPGMVFMPGMMVFVVRVLRYHKKG